jgi:hypothetical protein
VDALYGRPRILRAQTGHAKFQRASAVSTASNSPVKLNILDCMISPADGSGAMNHIEIQVNEDEIDVYATDA